jgi:very-short-patch-repair endonuclease
LLRDYIDFSINGPEVLGNGKAYSDLVPDESCFEGTLCKYLQKRGYDVAMQLGCSEYRIDLAVNHPELKGRYVLGVECDGTAYSNARTARERDRTRESVLHDIGWNTLRVWSTDWIKDPVTEGGKLVRRIDECIKDYTEDLPAQSSFILNMREGDNFEANDNDGIDSSYEQVCEENGALENPYHFIEYHETLIEDVMWNEEIDTESNYLVRMIKYVVEKESPIHFDLLCKRVAPVFNRQKITSVVKNSIKAVENLHQEEITIKNDYYWWNDTKKIEVRIPNQKGDSRAIDHIATEEIAEAMMVIAQESCGITSKNLLLATAKEFGFNRAGTKITKAMELAFQLLINTNKIKTIDGKVSICCDYS